MIPTSFVIEDLKAADSECTCILDDLLSGIQALDAAPIPTSDAEGALRGYTRMHRVFVNVYRVKLHVQRALDSVHANSPHPETAGANDA